VISSLIAVVKVYADEFCTAAAALNRWVHAGCLTMDDFELDALLHSIIIRGFQSVSFLISTVLLA
jgi:hypothetical protein